MSEGAILPVEVLVTIVVDRAEWAAEYGATTDANISKHVTATVAGVLQTGLASLPMHLADVE